VCVNAAIDSTGKKIRIVILFNVEAFEGRENISLN